MPDAALETAVEAPEGLLEDVGEEGATDVVDDAKTGATVSSFITMVQPFSPIISEISRQSHNDL